MKYRRVFALMLFAVFLMAGLWSVALGQTKDANLANVGGGGSIIRFDVVVQNAGSTLTVTSPDGRTFTREFKSSTPPEFTLNEKLGLPDGSYLYELRLQPSLTSGQKEALLQSRAKDDDSEAERAGRKRPVLPNLTQSGSFMVMNGLVVVGGLSENQRTGKTDVKPVSNNATAKANVPPAGSSAIPSINTAARLQNHRASLFSSLVPDQVIPDDLIVQGSACIGLDCVNNESFGFDTIRLKENNTRIKFDDTSTSAGFPANDWQLTANDSGSGGANKFSIEDITGSKVPFTVTGGAPTNSVFVDSTGRLGLRTSTPVLDIHANTSNTPALRFEQNNSGGFVAQTWDVAGNEANFFVRDVTGGSRLPFRIRPGAPTSSIDINASGNVGIGTASAGYRLHVLGSGQALAIDAGNSLDFFALQTASSTTGLSGRITGPTLGNSSAWFGVQTNSDNNANSGFFVKGTAGSNPTFMVATNGRVGINTTTPDQSFSVNGDASKVGGGSWQTFSDERLKNIKGNFRSGLKAVMQLNPIRYEYLKNNALGLKSEGEHIGLAAQSLEKVIPEAVTRNSEGYLMVNNDPIIWTMLNAIKEQQKEIEQLKGQIQKLQKSSHRRGK